MTFIEEHLKINLR